MFKSRFNFFDNENRTWYKDVIQPILAVGTVTSFNPPTGGTSILQTHFRPLRETFRKNILSIYDLPILQTGSKLLYSSNQTTTLYSLQFGPNRSTSRFISKEFDRKPTLQLALFWEDCNDEATAAFIIELLEALYQDLHHKDTIAHGVSNPTTIVNHTLFEQVSKLRVQFVKSLKSTFKPMFEMYIQSVDYDLFEMKYEVLCSQFSFYSILIFIKTVGLFPIVEDHIWIYSENQEMKTKMQCTSLAFLNRSLETGRKKGVIDDKFIETFSRKLGFFVQDRNYPESIIPLINDEAFVAEVKEWFHDFVSTKYYKDYFSEEFAVAAVQELSMAAVLGTSFFSTGRKGKRPSVTNNESDNGAIAKRPRTVRRYQIDTLNSFINEPVVCMDCCVLSSRETPKYYHAMTMTELKVEKPLVATRFFYCAKHGLHQLLKMIGDDRNEILWPASIGQEEFIQYLNKYEEKDISLSENVLVTHARVRNNTEKEYEHISIPKFSKGIIKKLNLMNQDIECSQDCVGNIGLAVECPSECNGGKTCSNKRVRNLRQLDSSKSSERYECRSNEKGKGLYALQVIERGEDIIEYVGEGIDLSKEKTTIFQYLMHLQSTYYIDAKRKGNLSRFINHSCNPNSEVKKVIVSFSLLLVVCCMSF